MRVTTAFKRLLRLDDVNVTAVQFLPTMVVVTVALRRRRLLCPHCEHKTRWRYDTRAVPSRWRHLDLGTWRLELEANLRRLRCPTHGVVIEAVPFARPGAHLTRDLDDLLAWLATRMDKTATARLCRVSWRTVGRPVNASWPKSWTQPAWKGSFASGWTRSRGASTTST
ncbi:MAG TPA: helix-turn-helix domain-containing protein [Acidimicrobiales bacterium]|nr:helix-turn-helix domain-containing protein [Acidimicrobiales bacterium]